MYGSLEEGTLCRSPVYGRFSFGLSVVCTYADARFVGSSWVKAAFRPSFPSVTFPNHYSMATGLHPDHHGLVNNFFYAPDLDSVYVMGNPNPAFFGGEPIWNTAESRGSEPPRSIGLVVNIRYRDASLPSGSRSIRMSLFLTGQIR